MPAKPAFNLGSKLRDRCSGFEGIAIARADMWNGCTQFGLQPPGAPDKLADATYFDHHQLEFVDDGLSKDLPPMGSDMGIDFGDEVKDRASGMLGIVIERISFMNGCVYFHIQPEAKKPNEKPSTELFMVQRLDVTKKAKAVQPEVKKKPTGGPTRSARELQAR